MKKLISLLALVLTICSTAMAEDGPTNNEIWYTSSDNNVVNPNDADAFEVSIVSNDYKDGKGVITFSGNLTNIVNGAFSYNSTLTSISIPASVTTIGEGAFSNCNNLTTLTFAEGSELETIQIGAFALSAISGTLNLPASLISIGERAFNGTKITAVTIPDMVTTIGEAAFAATKLTAVTIPAKVTTIEKWTFSSCKDLASLTFADGSHLETIKDQAFINTAIEGELTLPASLTSIGEAAFGATKIIAVTFPASVTTIGASAFGSCKDLTTLTFAAGSQLETIGKEAFKGTAISGNLNYLPASLKSIGEKAFSELAITAVTIPASVTTIGEEAFLLCGNLATLAFADDSQLKTIGNSAFRGTALSGDIDNLPASLEIIEYAAFGGLAITGVVIPASVTSIGEYAFSGCSSFANLSFADNSQLKTIGKEAFKGTAISGELKFPASLENIEYAAFGELAITSVTFPASMKSIGEYAFSETAISGDLTIPASVTTIGHWAFYECQISNIYMSSEDLSDINKSAFNNDAVIIVPAKLYETYKDHFDNHKVEVPLEEWKLYNKGLIEAAMKTVNTLSDTDRSTIATHISTIENTTSFDEVTTTYYEVLALINQQKAFEESVKGVLEEWGTKQPGTVIEIEGENGKTIQFYKIKKVKFIKVNEE